MGFGHHTIVTDLTMEHHRRNVLEQSPKRCGVWSLSNMQSGGIGVVQSRFRVQSLEQGLCTVDIKIYVGQNF